MLNARLLHLGLLPGAGGLLIKLIPGLLPGLHGRLRRPAAPQRKWLPRRYSLLQAPAPIRQTLPSPAGGFLAVGSLRCCSASLKLRSVCSRSLRQLLSALLGVFDGLLNAGHITADLIEARLHFIEGIAVRSVNSVAQFFNSAVSQPPRWAVIYFSSSTSRAANHLLLIGGRGVEAAPLSGPATRRRFGALVF